MGLVVCTSSQLCEGAGGRGRSSSFDGGVVCGLGAEEGQGNRYIFKCMQYPIGSLSSKFTCLAIECILSF